MRLNAGNNAKSADRGTENREKSLVRRPERVGRTALDTHFQPLPSPNCGLWRCVALLGATAKSRRIRVGHGRPWLARIRTHEEDMTSLHLSFTDLTRSESESPVPTSGTHGAPAVAGAR
jgi:hypothetical protein